MRKFHLVYPFFILLAFTQCKKPKEDVYNVSQGIREYQDLVESTEVDLSIPFPDTPYTLVELLSGVRCPTSPNAIATLDTLTRDIGFGIIPVVIHAGGKTFVQASPFHGDKNLNMPDDFAKSFFQLFIKPNGIPYYSANRIASSNMVTHMDSLIRSKRSDKSWMNIRLNIHDYDEASRLLSYSLQFHLQEEMNADLHFSSYILEDSIIGKQEYTQGQYDQYVHNHVLRSCPNWNVALSENAGTLAKGTKITRKFQYQIPQDLVKKNCHIVIFTHDGDKVYQATRLSLWP